MANKTLSARIEKLEAPAAGADDNWAVGTWDRNRPVSEYVAEAQERMAKRQAESERQAALPLEEQVVLLRADHAADVAERPLRKSITSLPMAAITDRIFAQQLAALEAKIVERDEIRDRDVAAGL